MNEMYYRCPRCGSKLDRETEVDGYPFVCRECDENFYEFEAIKSERKSELVENIDEN